MSKILDIRTASTWILGFLGVGAQKFNYEYISHIVIDVLTVVSLTVAIVYTIHRYLKSKKSWTKKKSNLPKKSWKKEMSDMPKKTNDNDKSKEN